MYSPSFPISLLHSQLSWHRTKNQDAIAPDPEIDPSYQRLHNVTRLNVASSSVPMASLSPSSSFLNRESFAATDRKFPFLSSLQFKLPWRSSTSSVAFSFSPAALQNRRSCKPDSSLLSIAATAATENNAAACTQEEALIYPLHVGSSHRNAVPVYVMLPLDTVTDRQTVRRRRAMDSSLAALKSAGVEGVMVDVWWGLVERDAPQCYQWSGYEELFEMIRSHGLKIQAVMSFHQCGGNVGDSCLITLPKWVVEEVDKCPDLVYTDRHQRRNYEYISLGCDNLPVLKGRTPVQVYADYMRSFRDNFKDILGETIVEIQVGMGPAGELRYPSYPESDGAWRFPGVGEFQCYDKFMLASLRAAAEKAGKSSWGLGGPCDSGSYKNWPEETAFFRREGGGWDTRYGKFFLEWYSSMLLLHGERILSAAEAIFRDDNAVKLSGKVAGIHWHYGTRSHASELTAGYYNTRYRDGYVPIAEMFGRHGAILNFTCIEMRDFEHPSEALCSPEGLVRQVYEAARRAGVPVAGENALPRLDEDAYRQISKNSGLVGSGAASEPLYAFTFLRMSQQLFQSDNWRRFVPFVRYMAEGKPYHQENGELSQASESETETFFHASKPFVQEAEAALARG